MAGAGGATLEDTPTWIVASVCSVIVLISIVFERSLHYLGKALVHRRETLYEALLKLKEELMLLGFISLMLVVSQDLIQKICIDESLMDHWLPCVPGASSTTAHYGVSASSSASGVGVGARRLLKGEQAAATGYCTSKQGKVPLLSLHALEQIHIFIFVLAVTHVALSAFTVLLGLLQMRKWKQWEKSIKSDGDSAAGPEMMMKMQQRKFIQDRYKGYGKATMILLWMRSFFKQFYGSVTKDDYIAMRLGFLMEHFRGNREYNFYDYMIKALEKDYKRVVGIKWYYWIFVMFFLLINVTGWHSYFWISLVPLTLLLVIGTKLEHIITRMAYEVNLKRAAVEAGDIAVDPSDDLFWFRSPRMLLILIHFILFQNAYEFAYLFWTLVMFGFNSCIMDSLGYSVSRITICVVVQVLCSYSTLPLYAIVSHMGSSFKSAVFADDVVEHLRTWASDARERGRGTDGAGCLGAGAAATGSSREGVRSQDKAEDPAAQLSS
ncbi:MLO-like protein 1 [Aegilops tauschii subsp. strangulata]|uniref:MLO-like protein 1 n=1 Tax=Aegilops tauschii subsp. strangulata TaxID=200361 RepID=UPI00098A42E3|nr:MLO-like protein 1 [Aegilops tauschii subsp. strangulata]